jgi:hypothetical protein
MVVNGYLQAGKKQKQRQEYPYFHLHYNYCSDTKIIANVL